MGVKVAVVGGGSTYTPELVEGFVRRADRFPVDELALLDVDADRLQIVGGLAGRMLERAGYGGRLVLTGDRDEAIDGAAFVIVQLRVGGQAARLLDETIPVRFGCVGQETTGTGRLREGPADRARRAGARRARRSPRGTRGVVRRLHQPDGARDPGAPGRGASRARPVQRRDQPPAGVRRAVRGRPRPRRARARRAQPPLVGASRPRRRRRPAPGAAGGASRRDRGRGAACRPS